MITLFNQTWIRKGISAVVVAAFIATTLIGNPSVLMASGESLALEEQVKFQKSLAQTLYSLPAEIGTVADISIGTRDLGLGTRSGSLFVESRGTSDESRYVIHIQDAHANPEAQRNIYEILKFLTQKYPDLVIGIEGTSGPLHPEYLDLFREYPVANQAVMDDLAAKGELSGAELFAWEQYQNRLETTDHRPQTKGVEAFTLVSGLQSPVFGIEDTELYRENLKTYRELLFKREEIQTLLNPIRAVLEKEGSRILNAEVRDFLKERARRKNGQYQTTQTTDSADLQAYIRYLQKLASKILAIDLKDPIEQLRFPNLMRLVLLEKNYSTHGITQVREEWAKVLGELRRAAHNPPEKQLVASLETYGIEKGFLVDKNASAKTTYGMAPALYPRRLLEQLYLLTQKRGVKLAGNKVFLKSFEFLIFQAEIDVTGLMKEMSSLEDQLIGKLVRTDAERAFVRKLGNFELFAKLLSLELTRDEYHQAREVRTDFETFIGENKNLTSAVAKAFHFYEGALKRDRALVENSVALFSESRTMNPEPRTIHDDKRGTWTMNRGSGTGDRLVVLITGGFHTDGIRDALMEQGVGYAAITPRISKMDGGKLYEKVMSHENADLSAYFKVKNPFATKQEAILFKEALEIAAPALSETYHVSGLEAAQRVQETFKNHPVLSKSLVTELLPNEKDHMVRFTTRSRLQGMVPANAAINDVPLTTGWEVYGAMSSDRKLTDVSAVITTFRFNGNISSSADSVLIPKGETQVGDVNINYGTLAESTGPNVTPVTPISPAISSAVLAHSEQRGSQDPLVAAIERLKGSHLGVLATLNELKQAAASGQWHAAAEIAQRLMAHRDPRDPGLTAALGKITVMANPVLGLAASAVSSKRSEMRVQSVRERQVFYGQGLIARQEAMGRMHFLPKGDVIPEYWVNQVSLESELMRFKKMVERMQELLDMHFAKNATASNYVKKWLDDVYRGLVEELSRNVREQGESLGAAYQLAQIIEHQQKTLGVARTPAERALGNSVFLRIYQFMLLDLTVCFRLYQDLIAIQEIEQKSWSREDKLKRATEQIKAAQRAFSATRQRVRHKEAELVDSIRKDLKAILSDPASVQALQEVQFSIKWGETFGIHEWPRGLLDKPIEDLSEKEKDIIGYLAQPIIEFGKKILGAKAIFEGQVQTGSALPEFLQRRIFSLESTKNELSGPLNYRKFFVNLGETGNQPLADITSGRVDQIVAQMIKDNTSIAQYVFDGLMPLLGAVFGFEPIDDTNNKYAAAFDSLQFMEKTFSALYSDLERQRISKTYLEPQGNRAASGSQILVIDRMMGGTELEDYCQKHGADVQGIIFVGNFDPASHPLLIAKGLAAAPVLVIMSGEEYKQHIELLAEQDLSGEIIQIKVEKDRRAVVVHNPPEADAEEANVARARKREGLKRHLLATDVQLPLRSSVKVNVTPANFTGADGEGADGVGLVRTEFVGNELFGEITRVLEVLRQSRSETRGVLPDTDFLSLAGYFALEYKAMYENVHSAAHERAENAKAEEMPAPPPMELGIRTLDLEKDKHFDIVYAIKESLDAAQESVNLENLTGMKLYRTSVGRILLVAQLAGIMSLSEGKGSPEVIRKIFFPMVENEADLVFLQKVFQEAKDLAKKLVGFQRAEKAQEELSSDEEALIGSDWETGIMVELPIAATNARELIQHPFVRFINLGTNDFQLYMLRELLGNFNLTRESPEVRGRMGKLIPPFINPIVHLVEETAEYNRTHPFDRVTLCVCGDMAQDQKAILFFLYLMDRFRDENGETLVPISFSVSHTQIYAVRDWQALLENAAPHMAGVSRLSELDFFNNPTDETDAHAQALVDAVLGNRDEQLILLATYNDRYQREGGKYSLEQTQPNVVDGIGTLTDLEWLETMMRLLLSEKETADFTEEVVSEKNVEEIEKFLIARGYLREDQKQAMREAYHFLLLVREIFEQAKKAHPTIYASGRLMLGQSDFLERFHQAVGKPASTPESMGQDIRAFRNQYYQATHFFSRMVKRLRPMLYNPKYHPLLDLSLPLTESDGHFGISKTPSERFSPRTGFKADKSRAAHLDRGNVPARLADPAYRERVVALAQEWGMLKQRSKVRNELQLGDSGSIAFDDLELVQTFLAFQEDPSLIIKAYLYATEKHVSPSTVLLEAVARYDFAQFRDLPAEKMQDMLDSFCDLMSFKPDPKTNEAISYTMARLYDWRILSHLIFGFEKADHVFSSEAEDPYTAGMKAIYAFKILEEIPTDVHFKFDQLPVVYKSVTENATLLMTLRWAILLHGVGDIQGVREFLGKISRAKMPIEVRENIIWLIESFRQMNLQGADLSYGADELLRAMLQTKDLTSAKLPLLYVMTAALKLASVSPARRSLTVHKSVGFSLIPELDKAYQAAEIALGRNLNIAEMLSIPKGAKGVLTQVTNRLDKAKRQWADEFKPRFIQNHLLIGRPSYYNWQIALRAYEKSIADVEVRKKLRQIFQPAQFEKLLGEYLGFFRVGYVRYLSDEVILKQLLFYSHIKALRELGRDETLIYFEPVQNADGRAYYEVIFGGIQDVPGQFANVTGVLAANGFGVEGARIRSASQNMVFKRFFVRAPEGADISALRTQVQADLQKVQKQGFTIEQLFAEKGIPYQFQALGNGSRLRVVQVQFSYDRELEFDRLEPSKKREVPVSVLHFRVNRFRQGDQNSSVALYILSELLFRHFKINIVGAKVDENENGVSNTGSLFLNKNGTVISEADQRAIEKKLREVFEQLEIGGTDVYLPAQEIQEAPDGRSEVRQAGEVPFTPVTIFNLSPKMAISGAIQNIAPRSEAREFAAEKIQAALLALVERVKQKLAAGTLQSPDKRLLQNGNATPEIESLTAFLESATPKPSQPATATSTVGAMNKKVARLLTHVLSNGVSPFLDINYVGSLPDESLSFTQPKTIEKSIDDLLARLESLNVQGLAQRKNVFAIPLRRDGQEENVVVRMGVTPGYGPEFRTLTEIETDQLFEILGPIYGQFRNEIARLKEFQQRIALRRTTPFSSMEDSDVQSILTLAAQIKFKSDQIARRLSQGEPLVLAQKPLPEIFPKVLVVDDEFGPRESLYWHLTAKLFGYAKENILKAASGAEALALMQKESVGVIIADLQMPGMSGVELAVRQATKPVLFITAHEYDRATLIDKPLEGKGLIYAVLDKSFKPVDLERKLRELANRVAVERSETRTSGAVSSEIARPLDMSAEEAAKIQKISIVGNQGVGQERLSYDIRHYGVLIPLLLTKFPNAEIHIAADYPNLFAGRFHSRVKILRDAAYYSEVTEPRDSGTEILQVPRGIVRNAVVEGKSKGLAEWLTEQKYDMVFDFTKSGVTLQEALLDLADQEKTPKEETARRHVPVAFINMSPVSEVGNTAAGVSESVFRIDGNQDIGKQLQRIAGTDTATISKTTRTKKDPNQWERIQRIYRALGLWPSKKNLQEFDLRDSDSDVLEMENVELALEGMLRRNGMAEEKIKEMMQNGQKFVYVNVFSHTTPPIGNTEMWVSLLTHVLRENPKTIFFFASSGRKDQSHQREQLEPVLTALRAVYPERIISAAEDLSVRQVGDVMRAMDLVITADDSGFSDMATVLNIPQVQIAHAKNSPTITYRDHSWVMETNPAEADFKKISTLLAKYFGVPVRHRPQRVLVVEDDPTVREMLRKMLVQLLGVARVDTAVDGRDALEKIRQAPAPYERIISDRDMPHMNGIELFEVVRHLSIPFVLVTGKLDEATETWAAEAQAQGGLLWIFQKPLGMGADISKKMETVRRDILRMREESGRLEGSTPQARAELRIMMNQAVELPGVSREQQEVIRLAAHEGTRDVFFGPAVEALIPGERSDKPAIARAWIASQLLLIVGKLDQGKIGDLRIQTIIDSVNQFALTGKAVPSAALEKREVHVNLPDVVLKQPKKFALYMSLILAAALTLNIDLYFDVSADSLKAEALEAGFRKAALRHGVQVGSEQFHVVSSWEKSFSSYRKGVAADVLLLAAQREDLPEPDGKVSLWFNSPAASTDINVLAQEITEALYASLDQKVSRAESRDISQYSQRLADVILGAIRGFLQLSVAA